MSVSLPRGAAECGGPVCAVSAVRRRSAVQKQPHYVIVPSQSCKEERRAPRALRNVGEKKTDANACIIIVFTGLNQYETASPGKRS